MTGKNSQQAEPPDVWAAFLFCITLTAVAL
jgi:hypothetical protein